MQYDTDYSLSDYETDNAEFFSKNQEEPFLHKFKNVLYPNPEFLSDTIPDDVGSYRIHFCIFYIETTCVLPFVKYALLKNDTEKTVGFVSFDSGSVDNNNLEKMAIDQFKLLFNSDQDIQGVEGIYKGFVVKQDDVYMFFDITPLLLRHHTLNPKFIYGVAHELCTLGMVFDYAIGQNIQHLFDVDEDTFPKCAIAQPWFYNLDGILEHIEIPRIGYICSQGTSDTLTCLTADELSNVFVPSDCLVSYEDYGFLYYFSENLLSPIENASYIRFVIFPMNTDAEDFNSVVFKYKKTQVWGIKSIDQFIPI